MKTLKSIGNDKDTIAVIKYDTEQLVISVNGTKLDTRHMAPMQIERVAMQLHYAIDAYSLQE